MLPQPLIVIGLNGQSGHGKDTAARILCAVHGFTRVSLGDGIREALHSIAGVDGRGYKAINRKSSYVRALQLLGTECREDVARLMETVDQVEMQALLEHWLTHAKLKMTYLIKHHPEPAFRFVVPDVRRVDEAASLARWVGKLGGQYLTWRITRPDAAPIPEASHSSETLVKHVIADRSIGNCGSYRDLARKIEDALLLEGIAP